MSSSSQLTNGLRIIFLATGFGAFLLLIVYLTATPIEQKQSSVSESLSIPEEYNPNRETHLELQSRRTHFNKTISPPGVIYKMEGGIGNQLFEYACCYALAKERNWPLYTFYIPSTEPVRFFRESGREFALDQFQVPVEDIIDNTTHLSGAGLTYIGDQALLERSYKEPKGFIKQMGYCQSKEYFVKYEKEVRQMFVPRLDYINLKKLEVYINLIKNSESVAVHVRRGDFTVYPGFFIPMSYQRLAIRKMASLLKNQGKKLTPVFFIFSDDISHTKKKFKDFEDEYKFVYVSEEGNTSIEDFYLMMLCKHNIIPNSTFSWWAAFLNENPDKIVIASAFNPQFWRLWERNKEKTFYMKLHGTLYHPKDWIVIDPFSGGMEFGDL